MVLRESGRLIEKTFNVAALVRPSEDVGVDEGDVLLAFADAVLGTDPAVLERARKELKARLGSAAVVGASAIVANFTKNDRIANGLGLPMESAVMKEIVELREELGLNDYRSAANTLQPR